MLVFGMVVVSCEHICSYAPLNRIICGFIPDLMSGSSWMCFAVCSAPPYNRDMNWWCWRERYQTWQQHKLLAWNHGHFFAAILSVVLNWLQPHPMILSKYTQNLVDVPLPCVFLWKLSAGDIFREDWSSSWEPPFLHSIDAAWLEHDTDTAKKK